MVVVLVLERGTGVRMIAIDRKLAELEETKGDEEKDREVDKLALSGYGVLCGLGRNI